MKKPSGTKQRKAWRKERVLARQVERTPDQQLARLNAGGYRALKERARLQAEINTQRRAA